MAAGRYWKIESLTRAMLRDKIVGPLDDRVLAPVLLKQRVDSLGAGRAGVLAASGDLQ